MGAQAGFGDRDAMFGNLLDQFVRSFRSHSQCFESRLLTPIMRASAASARSSSSRRVDFDQWLHAEFATESDEVAELLVVESGDNQQKTVGIIGARFPDLPGIEDKILAQNRKRDLFARIAQIFQRAVKEFALGKDGKRRGAGRFERLCERYCIKWIADDSARGRGRF